MGTHSFIRDLVELSIGTAEADDSGQLQLDVEVVFGEATYEVAECALRVRLRRAALSLIPSGGSIVNGTRYRVKLQEFKMSASEKSLKTTSSKAEADAGGKFEATIRALIPHLTVGVSASGTLDGKSDHSDAKEITIQNEVVLIEPAANGRWIIGAEEGDVRKPGGLLSGSYLQESRSAGDNAILPLCKVRIEDRERFKCQFAVTAKSFDFDFTVVQKWGKTKIADDTQKNNFAEMMRAAIAGIVLQKGLSAALKKTAKDMNDKVGANEILLAVGLMDALDVDRR